MTNGPGVTVARSAAPGTAVFNHFDVSASTESHFGSMTFHNGKSNIEGGSIWNTGTAHFLNCTFTENSTDVRGGAIATLSGATTIASDCTFMYNSATNALFGGGAIAALPGSLTTNITNCTLMENETVGNGGAVWANQAGTLWIEDSWITWNRATGTTSRGGGVYVQATTFATINQTDISSNTSGGVGGGLYVLDCNLTMTGGQLFNNTSTANGGGFYVDAVNKTVTLNQVSVTCNHSGWKGGGGFIANGTLAVQLNEGQLNGNRADGVGLNGSLPGIGVGVGAFWTGTVAPNQQTVELDAL